MPIVQLQVECRNH